MDQAEAVSKATQYVRLAKNVMPFDRAVLFGSYAAGKADEHSDIDVALFLDGLPEGQDYWELLGELYGLTERVDVHIEPHLFLRG